MKNRIVHCCFRAAVILTSACGLSCTVAFSQEAPRQIEGQSYGISSDAVLHQGRQFFDQQPVGNAIGQNQFWANEPSVPQGSGGGLRLQVGVEALYFSRNAASDHVYLTDDNGTEVSHSDLDMGHESTARYNLGVLTGDGTGFEVSRYDFGLFSSERVDDGPNITPLFFGGVPTNPAGSYTSTYSSRFNSTSVSAMLRKTPTTRIGIGYRHMMLDEAFVVNETGSFRGFYSRTDNRLHGAQIILEKTRPITNGLSLDLGVKGGLFHNSIDLDAIAQNIQTVQAGSATATAVNFHGGIRYRIQQGVMLRAGYEGMSVSGMALAPDQSQAINIFAPSNDFATGDFYIGGGYLGLALTF